MRTFVIASTLLALSCTNRAPLREGPAPRAAARSDSRPACPAVASGARARPPAALLRAARRNAARVLGTGVARRGREEVARLAARLVAALARADAADRSGVRRLFRGLPLLARELILSTPARPGPEEAKALRRLDLGAGNDVLPRFLSGLRLGMTQDEFLKLRPRAYRRRRWLRSFTLPVSAAEPYARARCRFHRGELKECRLRLRLSRIWPKLAVKAVAKWGRPTRRRRHRWYWRLPGARVTLFASRYSSERWVELRVRRRWRSRHSRLGSRSPRRRAGGLASALSSLSRSVRRYLPRRYANRSRSPAAASRYRSFSGRRASRSRLRSRSARIRRLAARRYQIPRRMFSRMFARPAAVQREVRMVPHEVGGAFQGLWLYDLRIGGRLRRLGLRNGDLILSIGGTRLSSPAKVLEALDGLRARRRFSVNIERAGQPRVLSYRIVDG